jgi:hypothetical protein
MTMRRSERAINDHLVSLDLGAVVYEPDGQVPPDFLIDGRIAVEARRLNQHEMVGAEHRGLEETSIPFHRMVRRVLRDEGPPIDGTSWFVSYTFRRPLLPANHVRRLLRQALREFIEHKDDPPENIRINARLRLGFAKAGDLHDSLFVPGMSIDHDAGGFVVADLIENLRICIAQKQRKLEPFKSKYSEWWLAFDDLIGYGNLDADEVAQLREHLGIEHDFAKIILVDPLDTTRAIVL